MLRKAFCLSVVVVALLPPLLAYIEDDDDESYVYIEDQVRFEKSILFNLVYRNLPRLLIW